MDIKSTSAQDDLLLDLIKSALSGSAATVATRHDMTPDLLAKQAIAVAQATIKLLKD